MTPVDAYTHSNDMCVVANNNTDDGYTCNNNDGDDDNKHTCQMNNNIIFFLKIGPHLSGSLRIRQNDNKVFPPGVIRFAVVNIVPQALAETRHERSSCNNENSKKK